MTQNYIFEKVFVIWYMIGIDNIKNKGRMFSSGRLDNLQPLPTQG